MVSVWDTHECVCVGVVARLQAPVRAVSFSHDGAFLAAAGDDDAIRDAADAETFARARASAPVRGGSVSSMRWSPTHHVLAFAGEGVGREERGERRAAGRARLRHPRGVSAPAEAKVVFFRNAG